MAVRAGAVEGASKGNSLMKELLLDIIRHINKLAAATGIDAIPGVQGVSKISPPPQVQGFEVSGNNDLFVATVTPSNVAGNTGLIYYKYQSSLTLPFESSQTIIEHGPTPQTVYVLNRGRETRFWRVFSKFASSDYGSPFILGDPVASFDAFVELGPPAMGTTWTITHNLNTEVVVQVRDASTGLVTAPDITIIDPNTITITFAVAQNANTSIVVIAEANNVSS